MLLLVLVLVIFFLSPRDPELVFKSATGVSLSFAPFKLSLKVRQALFARPRRVTLSDAVHTVVRMLCSTGELCT